MIVALYTSRIVLNALGIEDFGIWSIIGGVISVFGFINQSLSTSIFRYVAHAIGSGNKEKLEKTYSCSIIIHAGLAILIFLLCETAGEWLFTDKLVIPGEKRAISETVYHIAVITSAVSLLSIPFNSIIMAHERMHVFAYLSIAETLLRLIIAVVIYHVPSDKLLWYAVMMLASTLLILLFYYLYVRIGFRELRFRWTNDTQLFKSLLTFSGWSMCGNIATVGYTQGITILLNIFFGPVVNAARSISFQIEQAVRTFVVNFQSAINPQIIKSYAGGDMPRMHLLMFRSSRLSLFLLFIFALPIMLETEELLYLWLGQVPEKSIIFIRIMFCVIALETMSNSIMTGVVASGEIKRYQITVSTILLTIVPISYFVLKSGAPAESVFAVYLAIEVVAVAARLAIAQTILKFGMVNFVRHVIYPSVPAIIIGTIPPLILHNTMPDNLIRFATVITCGAVTSLAAIYLFGLDKSERAAITKAIKRKTGILNGRGGQSATGRLKRCKQRLGIRLAFRKQYRQWKATVPQQNTGTNRNKQLVIVPCDPWSVGGSRGDEAMITAVIQKYREENPDASITIISEGEEGSRYIENLPYPDISPLPSWNGANPVRTIYETAMAKNPDDVVLLGADCMDGYYSPLVSLTLLALHDLFSRTQGVRSHIAGFSFNQHPYRPMLKAFKTISPATRLNLRDAVSLERFKRFTGKDASLVADAAFMLKPDCDFTGYEKLKEWVSQQRDNGKKHIIGFNFHPMLRKYDNRTELENDARILSQNIIAVLQAKSETGLVLIPHDARPNYTDNLVLGIIAGEIKQAGLGDSIYYDPVVYRASQIKALCGLVDGLVSSRMHLAIAALGQGKSVMAAAYQGKFEGLFRHFGLPSDYLLSPEEFISDTFVRQFLKYIGHLSELNRQVEQRIKKVMQLSEKNLL